MLVRHAAPEVVAGVDPRRWTLSAAGRRAARDLGPRLPKGGVWVSSTETKAYDTLLCAGEGTVAIVKDRDFDEVRRDEPFDGDYRARRLAWVEGDLDKRHAGWETPRETAARFGHAVTAHAVPDSPLVIASHGMAITAWLIHGPRLVAPHRAARFWTALTFPDVIEVK
jgi:broad specificity phosphatase PhoE